MCALACRVKQLQTTSSSANGDCVAFIRDQRSMMDQERRRKKRHVKSKEVREASNKRKHKHTQRSG